MNIKMFVDQHDELLAIAGEISKYLEVDKLTNKEEEIINKLGSKISEKSQKRKKDIRKLAGALKGLLMLQAY